ncbi:MAG: M23 family metallopeptidase [Acidobacteriota bacterium]
MNLRLTVFLLALTMVASAHAVTVEAPQGSVVRWSGAESCGMDGRTYEAIEGVCYFPIDFRRAAGVIEIARWPAGQNIETANVKIVEVDFGEQDIDFPDESLVNLTEEGTARLYSEQAEIKPLFRRRGPVQFTLPLGTPSETLPEARGFGVQRSFNGVPKNPHTGVDYSIGLDNPVLSVAKGEVVLTGDHIFAGKSVYVDHGGGLISMYFHLNGFSVEKGDQIERGDEVGKIGSTGRSTGPHLHLGLRWRGARVDPTPLMLDLESLPIVP